MGSLEKEMRKMEQRLNALERRRHSLSLMNNRSDASPDNQRSGYKIDLELQQMYSDLSVLKIRYLMENL